MLDNAIVAALIVIAAAGIKWAAAELGITLDEETVNSLAGVLVAAFLALFGLDVLKSKAPGLKARGLLKD